MDKQKKIVNMFDEIAKTYDLANRVLSFGVDKSWRKKACDKTFKYYGKKDLDLIADVACGTGDMCIYWDKRAEKNGIKIKKIIGIDPSEGMLEVAKSKGINAKFVKGEAKDLPLEDESVDIVSISYGLRNVVDRVEALEEFARVLKEGGMLVILEFTKLKEETFISKIRDFYMKKVLPLIGGLLSKNYEAYSYLPNSIENFLTKEMLIDELQKSGFEVLEAKGYSMDISTMFIARKI
ncbi:MAG: bifunctional demethylmenaquinone methyltransferase/2-methoxy-6-polyprenyl-1,4-benzoquinol methylase UbiE [Epsilonproteobacteria bacterium]|nr:bifunctional demethylmenaquinone methyltransferase/2-methoxy-6-polyprenyl-1,4-benzoquinol methylase UbiE [Campylobacterota bacterium]